MGGNVHSNKRGRGEVNLLDALWGVATDSNMKAEPNHQEDDIRDK